MNVLYYLFSRIRIEADHKLQDNFFFIIFLCFKQKDTERSHYFTVIVGKSGAMLFLNTVSSCIGRIYIVLDLISAQAMVY